MELTIVNADPRYSAVKFIEPTTLGYIHIAAEVAPHRLPFLPNGREKSALLIQLLRGRGSTGDTGALGLAGRLYEVEMGLDTPVLLAPLEGEHSDFHIINYAQWEERLPCLLWQQLSKKSFRHYMLANLAANRMGAIPVLYRLV